MVKTVVRNVFCYGMACLMMVGLALPITAQTKENGIMIITPFFIGEDEPSET